MKVVKYFFIVILSIALFSACQKSNEELLPEKDLLPVQIDPGNPDAAPRTLRAIPFKVKFYTLRNYDVDGEGVCNEAPFLAFNYQVGEGTGTHLGKFDVTMFFCANGLEYENAHGTFVAANGDELRVKVDTGLVKSYLHPVYDLQFQDPFYFDGGTGRFEGASGGGWTNSFVNLFDEEGNFIPEHRTDHEWIGTIEYE